LFNWAAWAWATITCYWFKFLWPSCHSVTLLSNESRFRYCDRTWTNIVLFYVGRRNLNIVLFYVEQSSLYLFILLTSVNSGKNWCFTNKQAWSSID
jgi:hypothetical protein